MAHYRNGRPAKPGDKVVHPEHGVGIVHDINPGSETCNAKLAPTDGFKWATLGECIHVDDLQAKPYEAGDQADEGAS